MSWQTLSLEIWDLRKPRPRCVLTLLTMVYAVYTCMDNNHEIIQDCKEPIAHAFKDYSVYIFVMIMIMFVFFRLSLGIMGYGIQFGVPNLSGDLYLNIFLIGIIGAPLQFVNICLCNRQVAMILYLYWIRTDRHEQTVVTQIRRYKSQRLIRACTVYHSSSSLRQLPGTWFW